MRFQIRAASHPFRGTETVGDGLGGKGSWNDDLLRAFGPEGSVVDMPDDTRSFLEIMAPHGRFLWDLTRDPPLIEIANDYD